MAKRKRNDEFLNSPAMMLIREKLHKAFLNTPDEQNILLRQ
jgi:hypothetical protein